MTQKQPLSFVQSTFRHGRTPYSVSRMEPAMAICGAQDWPRGWGTEAMGYVRSRVNPAKEKLTFASALSWVGRMVVPVLALAVALISAFTFSNEPSTLFDGLAFGGETLPSAWLTQGHLLLCLSFLVINLTNRAYGPGFTLAQVAITWALLGALAFWLLPSVEAVFATGPLPSTGMVISFVAALALGQLLAIAAFDATRGPQWWTAPLWSGIIGMGGFVVVFYLVQMGANPAWFGQMGVDLVVKFALAVAMLAPYYLLRKTIRPQPGYNGA